MTEINTNTRLPNPLTTPVAEEQQKANAEAEALAIKTATRPRSVGSVGDVQLSGTSPAVTTPDVALPAPSVPSVDLSPTAVSGAQSFAGQLFTLGDKTDHADLLLARFLKIQVLTETEDLWSQVLAREAQSLLMLGALAQGKTSILAEAEAEWAKAEKLQGQAASVAEKYKRGDSGSQDGFMGGESASQAPTIRYGNETFTASDTASDDLKEAIDADSEAAGAEYRGDTQRAEELNAQAGAALERYIADPSRSNDVAEIDGTRYAIGQMSGGELMQVLGLLVAADFHNQRGNDLHAAYAQGVGASQMRKGQGLIDSEKRLEGHDEFLSAVMTVMSGTESADAKRRALSTIEEERQNVAALIEEGAAHSEAYSLNRLQPVQC